MSRSSQIKFNSYQINIIHTLNYQKMKAESMADVVRNKIAEKLRRGLSNAETAIARLEEEGKIAVDYLHAVGTERKNTVATMSFGDNDHNQPSISLTLQGGEEKQFILNRFTYGQLAGKLNIPAAYLTSLLMGTNWQRTLGYQILNTTNGWTEKDNVLVRTVGNEVRGILSDQFRRLDSELIFQSHLGEVFRNDAQISDGFMDDTRVMIESLLPEPIMLPTQYNGDVFLAFGTRLANSDYGDGALELRSFVLQGICLNGMVRESVMRKVHLGGRLQSNLALSQHTYELDSQAQASAIRDLTKNLYSSEAIRNRMLEVKAASDLLVEPENEIKMLITSGKLLKGEGEEIGKVLMRNRHEDGVTGESTLWKFTQGLTAYANSDGIGDRRRMELQEIAGELFNRIS